MRLDADQFKDIEIECEIFQRPERILLYGGSWSGKSHMVVNLVLRHQEKFLKIVICGAKNNLLSHPKTKNKTIFYENDDNPIYDPFEANDHHTGGGQTLLILDDLMSEVYNSQLVSKIFSKGRHLNLSVIVILQSYYPQGSSKSLVPMLKNNASIQIFFKLRNRGEMKLIAKKFEHGKKNQDFFYAIVEKEIYQKRYGYLVVYLDEPLGKYRNNLVYEDTLPFETVFFNK